MAPHTTPYRIIISIIYLYYIAIHINSIPSPVHAQTFQLASPHNTPHVSIMTYPADYGDDPPPHSFVLIMTVMMKVNVVEWVIMTVVMTLTGVESGTMEME
jgi:hypothetical protein